MQWLGRLKRYKELTAVTQDDLATRYSYSLTDVNYLCESIVLNVTKKKSQNADVD